MTSSAVKSATLMAGIPATNAALYHRLRFLVGDPTALIDLQLEDGNRHRIFILRDIEMDRARKHARADQVACPADYAPSGGLSGDRETATAQAAAECLRQHNVTHVTGDRSLPLSYVDAARTAGIEVSYDPELGVQDRRAKDEQELQWLREAQAMTEGAMEMACRLVANANADAQGALHVDGAPLTSERLRTIVDQWFLQRAYDNPPAIIAGGPQGADCHDHGSGQLYTGQPVIIDIFPRCQATRYNGDCTRTVVHGEIPAEISRMHAAVLAAKAAAEAATRAGVSGEDVHAATSAAMLDHGFSMGLPGPDAPTSYCAMTHGTGHGIGLDVHEPPLLDKKGPLLVVGDVLTIEPGLYCRDFGGVRVEDMVAVTADGCENFNRLPTGLDWRTTDVTDVTDKG
ncbi:MAG: aminopeptidase P family protein [Planctomycetales bacterium]|nr:aminopeptidase P family protein [Planctomycetales bacterium]